MTDNQSDRPSANDYTSRFPDLLTELEAWLVEALDAGESGGTVHLAMKLVEGVTLGDLVKERGPLPVADACALAQQGELGRYRYIHLATHGEVDDSWALRWAAFVLIGDAD